GRIADAGKTTRRRGSPEYRGRTRVACRRDYRRRRRDSPGGVAPSTQREQGNEDDDETEVHGVADAVVLGACPQGARWGRALSRHDPVTPRDEPTRFSHAAPPTAQGKQLSRSASTAARQSAHYSEHDRRAPQRNGFSVSRARNTQFSLTTSPFPTKRDARQDGEHMECQAHREATRHHAQAWGLARCRRAAAVAALEEDETEGGGDEECAAGARGAQGEADPKRIRDRQAKWPTVLVRIRSKVTRSRLRATAVFTPKPFGAAVTAKRLFQFHHPARRIFSRSLSASTNVVCITGRASRSALVSRMARIRRCTRNPGCQSARSVTE